MDEQLKMTRRRALREIGTAAIGGIAATSTWPLLGTQANAAKSKPAPLPEWDHGRNSASDKTVLMFRGNGAHTFYGTGPIPDKAPEVAWRIRTSGVRRRTYGGKYKYWSGMGWTGSAIKLGDYVYVGSVDYNLYCLHAMTGKTAWKYRGGGMFKSSVCAYDNRLYIGNTDNYLHCVDAETGKRVWRMNSGQDMDSSPCVVDGRLYVAGESGFARCIDPATGKHFWKTDIGGRRGREHGSHKGSETSPAVKDGEYYTGTYDGRLVAIDTKTGQIRWQAKTYDDTDSSPVIADDFVYVAAEAGSPHLYCFDREKGKEVWRYRSRGGYYSTAAVSGDRLYIGGEDKNVHCINARTGEAIWQFETRSNIWSSPAVVDDRVIMAGRDWRIYCLDAKTGKEIWQIKLDGRFLASPCIVDGKIWIGTATGYMYMLSA